MSLSLFFIFSFSLQSFAHELCSQEAIRQALLQARNSAEAKKWSQLSRTKVPRPARKNLEKVLQRIEKSVFGRKTLQIQEDLPQIPPMSSMNHDGVISISPQTLDSLNRKLSHPPDGAAFIIAHEIGHFVQHISFEHSPQKLSPSGLKDESPDGDEKTFNQLHAETDCIAVEILHQAGYPITEDIFKTLQIIKEECKTQRTAEFCNSADEVRESTAHNYIERYFSLGSPKEKPKNSATRDRGPSNTAAPSSSSAK